MLLVLVCLACPLRGKTFCAAPVHCEGLQGLGNSSIHFMQTNRMSRLIRALLDAIMTLHWDALVAEVGRHYKLNRIQISLCFWYKQVICGPAISQEHPKLLRRDKRSSDSVHAMPLLVARCVVQWRRGSAAWMTTRFGMAWRTDFAVETALLCC